MKANITIKIGCEAGSEFCGDCDFDLDENEKAHCPRFPFVLERNIFPHKGKREVRVKRCQQCLDAEKPASEQINKSKIEEIIKFAEDEKCEGTAFDDYSTGIELVVNKLIPLLKEEG